VIDYPEMLRDRQTPVEGVQWNCRALFDRSLVSLSLSLYLLTSFSFEENAEQECEAAVNQSLILDSSLDSKHLQASLRISQNRMSEACDILEEIFRGIKQNREMLARRTVIEELSAPNNSSPDDEGRGTILARDCLICPFQRSTAKNCASRPRRC
jgi:hypothetical protein